MTCDISPPGTMSRAALPTRFVAIIVAFAGSSARGQRADGGALVEGVANRHIVLTRRPA